MEAVVKLHDNFCSNFQALLLWGKGLLFMALSVKTVIKR